MPKEEDPCKKLKGAAQQECVQMKAMLASKALVQGPLCWLSLKLPAKKLDLAMNQLTALAMDLSPSDRQFMFKEQKRELSGKSTRSVKTAVAKSGIRSVAKGKGR